ASSAPYAWNANIEYPYCGWPGCPRSRTYGAVTGANVRTATRAARAPAGPAGRVTGSDAGGPPPAGVYVREPSRPEYPPMSRLRTDRLASSVPAPVDAYAAAPVGSVTWPA